MNLRCRWITFSMIGMWILVAVLYAMTAGCVSISWNPQTQELHLQRFLTDTSFEGLTATVKDPSGEVVRQVTVNGYQSEQAQVAGQIAEGVARGLAGGVP